MSGEAGRRALRVRRGPERDAQAELPPPIRASKPKSPVKPNPKGGQPSDPPRERVLRLFFAVPLPADLRAELVAAQRKLTDNWRRVEAEQLHLTLAYLPGVAHSRVPELQALGRRLASSTPFVQLGLRGTGYHPNVGSPRVWFVKVEGAGLSELATAFQTKLAAAGFECEGAFQPHVTLARKKGPAPRVPPVTFAQTWTAQNFALIHTFLPRDKSGPVYDTVSQFALNAQLAVAALAAPEPSAPTTSLQTPPEEHHG
ncbi:RNA 2',3'-cyclic phosphodiesterase [Deinococcus sp.]|uniref:RNA 2',3'-cyclic phosphodiesterase n=1 Tax=Deinococcus sp. TaxID=47478 RepID=UPI003CC56D0D